MIHIKHLCHVLAEQKYISLHQTSRTNVKEKINNKNRSTIQWWRAISSCLLCLSVLTIGFFLISLFYEFWLLLLWYGSSMPTPRSFSSLSVCVCLCNLFQIQFINVGFIFSIFFACAVILGCNTSRHNKNRLHRRALAPRHTSKLLKRTWTDAEEKPRRLSLEELTPTSNVSCTNYVRLSVMQCKLQTPICTIWKI